MINYRLLLVSDDGAQARTGFVFCAGDDHARASAQALFDRHPEAAAVEVNGDDGPVCRLERSAA